MNDIVPLDLIAFQGGDFYSRLLTTLQEQHEGHGECSHVAVVINKELIDLDFMENDKLYLFESTISTKYDVVDMEQNKGYIGVQIRPLKEVIDSYYTNEHCKVMWCKLIDNPYIKDPEKTKELFLQCYEKNKSKVYEYNPLALLAVNYPFLRKIRDHIYDGLKYFPIKLPGNNKEAWKFCSELVADVYKQVGVFPETIDSSNVSPVSFFGDIDGDIDENIDKNVDGDSPKIVESPVLLFPDSDPPKPYHHKRALIISTNWNDNIDDIEKLLRFNNYDDILTLSYSTNSLYEPNGIMICKALRWFISGSSSSDFMTAPVFEKSKDDTFHYFHYKGHGLMDDIIFPIDFSVMGTINFDLFKTEILDKINGSFFGIFDCDYDINIELKWYRKYGSINYRNGDMKGDITILKNIYFNPVIQDLIENNFQLRYNKIKCDIISTRYIQNDDFLQI